MDFELFDILDCGDWHQLGENVEMHDHEDIDSTEAKLFDDFMQSFEDGKSDDLEISSDEISNIFDFPTGQMSDDCGIEKVERLEFPEVEPNFPQVDGTTTAKKRRKMLKTRDCRPFYIDALMSCANTGDAELIRRLVKEISTSDVIVMTCWLNEAKKITHHRYREFRGQETYINFVTTMLTAAPDGVAVVRERKLYVNPDGSSLLVCKLAFDGSVLFDMLFTNFVRRTQNFLSRFNPFATLVPRSVTASAVSTSGMSRVDNNSNDEDNSTASRKRKQTSQTSASAQPTIFSNRSLSRDRKVSPDKIEVGTAQSKFVIGTAKKQPSRISVTGTAVIHINSDFKIYKAETFRRFETHLFR